MWTDAPPEAPIVPITSECVVAAADWQGIPRPIMQAILRVEGGTVGRVSLNNNGSADIGPAQINTLWLPTFAKQGVTVRMLRDNGCANVYAAAWILKSHLIETGDLWKAVGYYHSRTPSLSHAYRQRVRAKMESDQ